MVKTVATIAVTASLCFIGTSVSADDITYPIETLAVSVSIIPVEELPVEDTTDVIEPDKPWTQETMIQTSVQDRTIDDSYTLYFDDGDWSLGGKIEVIGDYPNVTFDITNTSEDVPSMITHIDANNPIYYEIQIVVTSNADGKQYKLDPFVIYIYDEVGE